MSPSTRVGKYQCELCGIWKPTGGKSITRVGTGFLGWRKHASEGRAHNTHRGSSSTPRLVSSFRFSRRSPQPPPSPSPPASPPLLDPAAAAASPTDLRKKTQICEINVAGPSVGNETNVAGLTLDREACEVQSPPSGTSVHGSGKKRKKSQVASVLDDYLEHKKNQTNKTVEAFLEKKTRGEESMDRCIHIFEAMEDLTDEEKAIAAEVFENELYREMFLKLTIHNVRLIWLRRKISFVECLFLLEEVATIVQLKLTKVYQRFLLLFCLNFSKSQ
ncbi:hypothetical protein ZEAMMB73_Zm00001d045142 [Zea mays]|uniref:Uncharacterized protein n=1 Tax=Zea mays TaxID=4577 RepID=A0A1D6NTY8_MAIZE|nr:hypothetical protein ZEAMMB73_Zm00001d045142 [Zea mays]